MDALDPLTAGAMKSPPRGLVAGYWRAAFDLQEMLAAMINTVDQMLFVSPVSRGRPCRASA